MSVWRIFRIVFSKEMRELIRDRKTLFWLLAPPIILPAIAILAVVFVGTQTARYITQGFPVQIVNEAAAPGLVADLKKSSALIVLDPANNKSGDTALITLTIPDDFQKTLDGGKSAHLTLTQRDSTFVTTLALGAVRSEVNGYSQYLFNERLKASGLDQAWLTPINLDETKVAATATSVTASATGGGGGASAGLGALFLPLAVTSWLVGGGLGLIVDTTVGEKERQTIESVLVTPASRVGVVLGKLSAVFIASLLVMGLWMIEGMGLSLLGDVAPKIMAAQSSGGNVDIMAAVAQSGRDVGSLIIILLLLLIPFIIVLNSLVMAFCSFASSYRESNTFLFLLQLLLPAMVLLSVFAIGPGAGIGWYAAPILGTIVAIRDLFSQTLAAGGLIVAVVSTSVYAIAALSLASYIYSREWALVRGI